jgi:hypothetical protein
MASIAFTDGDGAATLQNGVPNPGNRFRGWTPRTMPVGAAETSLGTGARFMFAFRTDHTATFTMTEIPMASLATALRLMAWLLGGGTCAVTTGDNASRVYPTCGLAEGTAPELVQQDAANLTYALTLTLVNLAGTPTAMLCDYTDQ